MMTVIPQFNMRRVIQDYAQGMYWPAAAKHAALAANQLAGARQLAQWKQRVRRSWPGVALRRLSVPPRELLRAGRLQQRVAAALNGLSPADVQVEFIAKRLVPRGGGEPPPLASWRGGEPAGQWREALQPTGEIDSDGSQVYALDAAPPSSGQFATEIRIRPAHSLLSHPLEMGLMRRL
jgi:starch phosphorylase